mmetsp:Transcript_17488/g.37797  ORF Transcript_17488/g.37797 Transcript_17488/m.37797 type:complete len:201 (+) Transcript_17488:282-884(+)
MDLTRRVATWGSPASGRYCHRRTLPPIRASPSSAPPPSTTPSFISEMATPCSSPVRSSYFSDMEGRRIAHASKSSPSSHQTAGPAAPRAPDGDRSVPLRNVWCAASLATSSGRSRARSGATSFADEAPASRLRTGRRQCQTTSSARRGVVDAASAGGSCDGVPNWDWDLSRRFAPVRYGFSTCGSGAQLEASSPPSSDCQ